MGKPADAPRVRPVPDEDRVFAVGQRAEVLQGQSVVVNFTVTDREPGEYSVRWKLPDGSFLRPGERKNNVQVSTDTRFLTISNAQPSDVGNYQAVVTNAAGSNEASTRLQVFSMGTAIVFNRLLSPPNVCSSFQQHRQ